MFRHDGGQTTNKKVTGKAADARPQAGVQSATAAAAAAFGASNSGYNTMQTTTPKLQVQLPNLQNLFQSNTSGTGRQVTGKAADANPQATTLGASNSNYTGSKTASSLPRVQTPARQTTTQNLGTTATPKQVTGKAADSGYTQQKKQASQAANRQTVQNWWNNEQVKSAQDNSTDRAYTAKLTGGANIDNSTEVVKSLQRTFGGANDSAETQYNRTLKSKMGYGRNWGNPQTPAGNMVESGVASIWADGLNALGTALKSDRRSGLEVDSGDIEAKATGKEWYNRAGNYLQKEADWARMLSENAYLRGSRNLNNAQELLFDAGIAGTQMASDVALGTLTGGSAMVPMAIRSFGSGAQRARQAGATENQQIAYGTASAIKEALTEKGVDGLGRIYGKGAADDFVDSIARSFAKSDGGQALVRGLVNMGGEGAEEIAGGFVDPALQSIYNGKTLVENYRELNMSDLRHEGAVGMLLGGLGGSVNMAQTGSGQVSSYADALRNVLAEKNATALDTNAGSFNARYKELERKYLEGTLGKEEEDEIWKLERMRGQIDTAYERVGRDPKKLAPLEIEQWRNNLTGYQSGGKIGDTDGYSALNEIRDIDFDDETTISNELSKFSRDCANSDVEKSLVLSPDGHVYGISGAKSFVNTGLAGEDAIAGSVVIHNHPIWSGYDRGDSFSRSDLLFAAKHKTGMQYLVSGTRKDAFLYIGNASDAELYEAYEKAFEQARKMAFENDEPIEFEQEAIMRILDKTLEGFIFYENVRF